MMIVEITSGSNPYTLSNLSIFLLWIFGIVPAILLSVWLINPLSIKKLLSTFDLTEKSLDKKKEKTDVQQPEKTKDSKTSNEQIKTEILELIRLVDCNKDRIFRWGDVYCENSFFAAVASFLGLTFFVYFFLSLPDATGTEKLALIVAFTALAVSFFSFLERLREDVLVRVRLKRTVEICETEKFEHQRLENDKPLLKVLIKIRAKNTEFDLKQIYEFNKDMFTPEKLMERLCE
jgi:hypothetical protein